MTEKEAVQKFADAMVAKLTLRKAKYGEFGWRKRGLPALKGELLDELDEFHRKPEDISELVDIACVAFMIYDRIKQDEQKETR